MRKGIQPLVDIAGMEESWKKLYGAVLVTTVAIAEHV